MQTLQPYLSITQIQKANTEGSQRQFLPTLSICSNISAVLVINTTKETDGNSF